MRVFLLFMAGALLGTALMAQSGLPQGSPADLHGLSSPEAVAFTPQQGAWNAVAVGAMTTSPSNVGVDVTGISSLGSSACGFVLVDGNQGTINAATGNAFLTSGSTFQNVSALHPRVAAVAAGGGTALTFLSSGQFSPSGTQTGEFIHLWEIPINAGTEGIRNVRVSKAGNLVTWKWSVFAPATSTTWLPRSASTYGEFALSATTGIDQQINFDRAGRWCIAVYCEFTDHVDVGGTAVTVQVSPPQQGSGNGGGDSDDSSCSTGEGDKHSGLVALSLGLILLGAVRLRQRAPLACVIGLASLATPVFAGETADRQQSEYPANFALERKTRNRSLFQPILITQDASEKSSESDPEIKVEWPLQRDTLSAGIGPALGSDLSGVFGFISSHFAFIVQAPSFGALGMAGQMGFGYEWGESSDGSTKFEHEVFSFTWAIGLAYHLRLEALPWTKTFTPYVAFYPVGGAYAAYKSSAKLGGEEVTVGHDAYLYWIDSVLGADYHVTEHISLGTSFHLGGTIGTSEEKVHSGPITSTTTIEGRFTFFWEVVKFTWTF